MAKKPDLNELLRALPQVDALLRHPTLAKALEKGEIARSLALKAVRESLDTVRKGILAGEVAFADHDGLASQALACAMRSAELPLRRVINATGVVLHTNLGRAPLPKEALCDIATALGYCNLEYDLATGQRGHRHDHLVELIKDLTGAEDALVVNNNAAAVLLTLTALAGGGEVIVSRGELVEIGGSFRIPEVLAQSGATLVEVGTTNKTHPRDYEEKICPQTTALLKVHTSNYKIMGFTRDVSIAELCALKDNRDLWVIEDLGSGLLLGLDNFGEPTVRESLAAGADVVTFSGDKLLGGPQAGIIAGKSHAIRRIAKHPLMRALRPDKVTIATLLSVLSLYRDPETARAKIPALKMLNEPLEELERKAQKLLGMVAPLCGSKLSASVEDQFSEAGGGSLPMAKFPTKVLALTSPTLGANALEERLRGHKTPVIARISEGKLLLDVRTIDEADFAHVAEAITEAL